MPQEIKQYFLNLQKPKYETPSDVKQSIEWSNSLDSMSDINLTSAIKSIYNKLSDCFTSCYDDWLKLSTFLNND